MKILLWLSFILYVQFQAESSCNILPDNPDLTEEALKTLADSCLLEETPLTDKKLVWRKLKPIPTPQFNSIKVQVALSIALDERSSIPRKLKMIRALENISCELKEEVRQIWIAISQTNTANIRHLINAATHITILTENLNSNPMKTPQINQAWERVALDPRATLVNKIEAGQRSYSKITWQAVYEDKDAQDYHQNEALRRIRMIEKSILF